MGGSILYYIDQKIVIATLGPPGTYSEMAAREYGAPLEASFDIVFASGEKCMKKLKDKEASIAILPAENIIDGIIGSTFDLLVKYCDCIKVIDEIYVKINHVLAAKIFIDSQSLREIYSHPSPFNQCSEKISLYASNAETIPVGSTSEAARIVSNRCDNTIGVICSLETAQLYDLAILNHDFNNYAHNKTRFFVCGLTLAERSDYDLTLFAVKFGNNSPGQLFSVTQQLATRDINLVFVHSRPSPPSFGEYVLFFELIGHYTESSIACALINIAKLAEESGGWFTVIGSHPRRSIEAK